MITLFNLTFYSFLFCSLAALIAVMYFIAQVPVLDRRLRLLAYLNIIICGFSSILHAYYLSRLQPLIGAGADADQLVQAISEFPLALRYVYWLVATVLLIIMFPLLIGLNRVGTGFVFNLALADAGMIISGFLSEQSIRMAGEVTMVGLLWFFVGMALWIYMLVSIFIVLRRLPSGELIPAQRDALGYMYFFILFGWTIYPAGYIGTILFEHHIASVLREFTFNIGDIVNKVIWGFLVVNAAREVTRATKREVATQVGAPLS